MKFNIGERWRYKISRIDIITELLEDSNTAWANVLLHKSINYADYKKGDSDRLGWLYDCYNKKMFGQEKE